MLQLQHQVFITRPSSSVIPPDHSATTAFTVPFQTSWGVYHLSLSCTCGDLLWFRHTRAWLPYWCCVARLAVLVLLWCSSCGAGVTCWARWYSSAESWRANVKLELCHPRHKKMKLPKRELRCYFLLQNTVTLLCWHIRSFSANCLTGTIPLNLGSIVLLQQVYVLRKRCFDGCASTWVRSGMWS